MASAMKEGACLLVHEAPELEREALRLAPKSRRWNVVAAVAGFIGVACLVAAALWTGQAGSSGHDVEGITGLVQDGRPLRKGSFIVLGDWGWDPKVHGNVKSNKCQKNIAWLMEQTMRELGDVKFVINVGDSFYPGGLNSKWDWQWDHKWRNIFPKETRDVSWYTVYGNHDYHYDPCACSDSPAQCAQVNGDKNNKAFFYMPSYYYYEELPELDLEIIAMDTNDYMWAWDKAAPEKHRKFQDCEWTSCPAKCEKNAKLRSQQSFNMFYERMRNSPHKNLLVFSHYPTDYFWMHPEFIGNLSDNSRHNIEYFGGHRHNTDDTSTTSTHPNHNWLVGGGGGWGCDGRQQGFIVGEIQADGTVTTSPRFVDIHACC